MLWMSVAAIVLSFAFIVVGTDRVAFWFMPSVLMPQSCPSRVIFNFNCPGCGLTRSYIYLAHGQWRESFAIHRVGWLMAAATVAQVPYRTWCLRGGAPLSKLEARLFSGSLIAALLLNWVLGQFGW